MSSGGFQKVVLVDVSLYQKPERGYKKWNDGTQTGTRAQNTERRYHKLERGYIRQNHPFTKPPFLSLSKELREGKPGGFPNRGVSHFFFWGKVQIVSRTLLGLFLVGAVNRPRKRKRANRENP